MVSAIDRARRAFVTLLKTLAATYGVGLQLTRESSDADVRTAFRKVSAKVHPDHGGSVDDQKMCAKFLRLLLLLCAWPAVVSATSCKQLSPKSVEEGPKKVS